MASEKEKEFQAAAPEYTATAEVSVPLLPQGNLTAEAQLGYPPSYQPSANDQSGQAAPPYPYPSGGVYQPTVGTSKQPYPTGPYPQPSAGPYGQPGAGPYGQPGAGPYGQPGAGPYGQPGAGPYGQPGAGPYGQPGSVSYTPYGPGQQQVVVMAQPGQYVPGATVVVSNAGDSTVYKVKDLLPLSIINLICCCLVFGIVATVYSVRIREAKRHHDYAGAKKMYKVMLGMNIAGIVIGTLCTVISIVVNVTAARSY